MKKVVILFFVLLNLYCKAQSFNFDDFKQLHFYSFDEANTRLINENFILSSSSASRDKSSYIVEWKYYSQLTREKVMTILKTWDNINQKNYTFFWLTNSKLFNSIKAQCIKSNCTFSKQYDNGLDGFTTVYEGDIFEIEFSIISEDLRKNNILHQASPPYKITIRTK